MSGGSRDTAAFEASEAKAYVDGSYDDVSKSYSYGMVIFDGGMERHFSKKFENDPNSDMRNVAGEIQGAMAAMQYCCPYRYKIKGCGCMKGKIQAKILEEIVSESIRRYTEDFLSKEQTRMIEKKVKDTTCKSLIDTKKKLKSEEQKLQNSKIQFYEKYKQGIVDKEEYLSQKENLTEKMQVIEQEISIIENKIDENMDLEHNLNVDILRECVSKGKLVLEWIDEIIKKIYVYDKDKVEIVWRFEE